MTLLETHRRAFRQSVPGYGQRNQALQKLEQALLRRKNDPLLDKCDAAQIVRDKQGELQWDLHQTSSHYHPTSRNCELLLLTAAHESNA